MAIGDRIYLELTAWHDPAGRRTGDTSGRLIHASTFEATAVSEAFDIDKLIPVLDERMNHAFEELGLVVLAQADPLAYMEAMGAFIAPKYDEGESA